MPVLNHTHKYVRRESGASKYPIYKCLLPDCTSFINEIIAENKKSLCYFCETEFHITKDQIRRSVIKLQCGCRDRGKKKPTVSNEEIKDMLKKLGAV